MSPKSYNKDLKKDPRRGDDRNLVIVDQDFGQPDLEDRMWLFWIRNKVAIMGGGLLIVIGILGYIGWHAVGDFKLSSMQAEYQNIGEGVEAKLLFASKYEGHPLAGIAALDAADNLFKEKKYDESANAYAQARKSLAANDNFQAAYAGRAILGVAFSKLNASDKEGAIVAFKELAKSASVMEAYPTAERAQAMYNLALIAVEKKDYTEARKWLDAMDRDIDPLNPWQDQKRRLMGFEPELAKAVALETIPATPVPNQPSTPAPVTPDAEPVS
ncbi:MAG: tetratricopeptide repeat protein, partial [Puniceicoccales bacterium]|nr:tetratricopeptide repeat protein [Puniceicoccales bacterium]